MDATIPAVICPDCRAEVWDRAHGYKLNKCHGCGLAFDAESAVIESRPATPETWAVRAAFKALQEVGWNCLTPEERATINKWEGR